MTFLEYFFPTVILYSQFKIMDRHNCIFLPFIGPLSADSQMAICEVRAYGYRYGQNATTAAEIPLIRNPSDAFLMGNQAYEKELERTAASMHDGISDCKLGVSNWWSYFASSSVGTFDIVHDQTYIVTNVRVILGSTTVSKSYSAKILVGSNLLIATTEGAVSEIMGDNGFAQTTELSIDVSSTIIAQQEVRVMHRLDAANLYASSYCGLAGSLVVAGDVFETYKDMEDPCACQKKCNSNTDCTHWSFCRSPSSSNYRNCDLGASAAVVDDGSIQVLDYVSGEQGKQANINVKLHAKFGPTMTISSSASTTVNILDVCVFLYSIPAPLQKRLEEKMRLIYGRVFSTTVPQSPIVTLNALVELHSADGGQVAFISPAEMQSEFLTPEDKNDMGLSEKVFAVSSIYDFMVGNLIQQCVVEAKDTPKVASWGFTEVAVSGYSGSVAIDPNSIGVEVESVTLCRRTGRGLQGLGSLPKSTVCGIDSQHAANELCAPPQVMAHFEGQGIMSITWLPGCMATIKYQVTRDRSVATST
jgi:hypothetical protein